MTPDANGLEPEQPTKRELAAENARLRADLARATRDRAAALRTLAYLDDQGLTDAENVRLRDETATLRGILQRLVTSDDAYYLGGDRGAMARFRLALADAREALR